MARQKKQPNIGFGWENYNRQYQVHQLLQNNDAFQNDAEAIRQKYDISDAESLTQNEQFLDDLGKIINKVKAPGHYEAIVISLVLDRNPEYDGTMIDPPKQDVKGQFRVKPALFKNLVLRYMVKERHMTYKQAFDYFMDNDMAQEMNYTDISKHLAKLEQQIHDIYS